MKLTHFGKGEKVKKEKKGKWKWLLQIWSYTKPFRSKIITVIILYMVQTVCTLFMPYIMSEIVNNGVATGDIEHIYIMSGVMLGITILSLMCSLTNARLGAKVIASTFAAIKKAVFNKTNSLTFEEFGKVGSGSLLTRTTEDVWGIVDTLGQFIYAFATFPVMFFGGVILSLQCDLVLSLILLVTAPIIILLVRIISHNLHSYWRESDRYCDIQNKVVRERLTGLRVIRAFDKEQHEHERISDATRTMADYIIAANVRSNSINPISVALLNTATVIMLYVASKRIQTEALLTAGDVMAVIQYVTLIMEGIMVVSWSFVMVPRAKVCGERIAEVLSMQGIPEGDDTGERFDGEIKFDHVTFAYEGSDSPALKNLCMDIKAGEVIGIIGGTGSGKTTITKLLMDFYAPTEGTISIGGKGYSELTKETVRGNLSIALQKGMIFGATVAENVRMGDKDATDEEIRAALNIAQMGDFVDSHEEGLEYKLLQAGSNISGGQKQRINIARTIIKKASVYIFDDSFSALDYLTESRLRKELNEKMRGKTQIIVTQRAATAMRCDRVYVIDRGEFVGVGTHEELMKNCAIYKEIYYSQLGGDRELKGAM